MTVVKAAAGSIAGQRMLEMELPDRWERGRTQRRLMVGLRDLVLQYRMF